MLVAQVMVKNHRHQNVYCVDQTTQTPQHADHRSGWSVKPGKVRVQTQEVDQNRDPDRPTHQQLFKFCHVFQNSKLAVGKPSLAAGSGLDDNRHIGQYGFCYKKAQSLNFLHPKNQTGDSQNRT